ncbi:hypothetical protein QVD17_28598 [Tagetes erecta]|uniref:Uncharacterized protein n=1 Tax=Tagetes erecta TaxID=13708 RepID=A0AAD8NSW3_TARER|nr:hypothetical protein QVD17_28598 [Tagetes erecta]
MSQLESKLDILKIKDAEREEEFNSLQDNATLQETLILSFQLPSFSLASQEPLDVPSSSHHHVSFGILIYATKKREDEPKDADTEVTTAVDRLWMGRYYCYPEEYDASKLDQTDGFVLFTMKLMSLSRNMPI